MNDVERDLVEGLSGYVEQLKRENRMNDVKWIRDAAEAIEGLALSGDIDGLTFARIIAQHAPPDIERELRELARDAKTTVMFLVSIEDYDIVVHPFGTPGGKGPSIPAAIRAAREAMGR